MSLYTNSEISEKEMKKKFLLQLQQNNTPRNKLNDVKDRSTENHKALFIKTEKETKEWTDTLCSWIP